MLFCQAIVGRFSGASYIGLTNRLTGLRLRLQVYKGDGIDKLSEESLSHDDLRNVQGMFSPDYDSDNYFLLTPVIHPVEIVKDSGTDHNMWLVETNVKYVVSITVVNSVDITNRIDFWQVAVAAQHLPNYGILWTNGHRACWIPMTNREAVISYHSSTTSN